jgi:SAM-dependent methyltransferase
MTSSSVLTAPSPEARLRYALDPGWYAERERLGSLTQLYDDTSLRLARQLGLAPGWRCAEVGAGTGSVAQLLAASVGPTGTVLALDTDTRFLDPLAGSTLTVRRQDVTAEPLPERQFDLVHARLVLEHLLTRDAVLVALARALVPGGWLLVEDFDWAATTPVDPPSALYDRVTSACRTILNAHGHEPAYGRRLPRAFRAAGLTEVGTSAESAQVDADPVRGIPQWELLVAQLAPAMLAAELVTEGDLEGFSELAHDGDTAVFAPLMVSTWGRRPAGPVPR